MMLEYAFKLKDEAEAINNAVNASLVEGIVTEDIAENVKPSSTTEVGDWIAEHI
jgi:3-isopropylmalate dehydrogenase